MASVSAAAEAKTGNNQFLRIVAAISTISGWLSAGMIMLAVLITCQMIFIRFVLKAHGAEGLEEFGDQQQSRVWGHSEHYG